MKSLNRPLARLGLALVAACLLAAPSLTPVHADGAWLDAPLQNWNTPGADVSPIATTLQEPDPRCVERSRPTESIEDMQVEKQGFKLVGMAYSGWGVRIITGATQFDGMCRPLNYQTFVFLHGVFAGTLSPDPMNSRTDGDLFDVIIPAKGPGESVQVAAAFSRYKPDDAMCCPSARSDVTYEIAIEGGKPVLKPLNVNTSPIQAGN